MIGQYLKNNGQTFGEHVMYSLLWKNIKSMTFFGQFRSERVKLAEANIPFKTKKQVLVHEGGGFIQEFLTPVISSLGFLML